MDITIHYMDLRAAYRGFEELYREAQKIGVKFIRGRVADVQKNGDKLVLRGENIDLGEYETWQSDLVVLVVGQEPYEGANKIAEMLELPLAENGFIQELPSLDHAEKTGIGVIGCALGPRGIRYSVKEAIKTVDEVAKFLETEKIEVVE